MYDVIALGELLIDLTHVSTGEDGYPVMAAHPGGAPANFLAAVSKFGGSTAFIGKVGDDTFGHMLEKTLKENKIDTRGIVFSKDVFTTLAFVTLDEQGDRSFAFARKPGADTLLCPDEVRLELIDEARVFHFGTLSLTHERARAATYKAVEHARSRGKLISFDPNLRKPLWDDLEEAKKQMNWGLTRADVVKISDDEVDFLWGISPGEGAEMLVNDCGVRLALVSCGSEGCIYKNKNAEGKVPALKGVRCIDTTGAGDIFGGSAMYKILESGKAPDELSGQELDGICRFACTAAGLSVGKSGGISSVPGLVEVIRSMDPANG